MTNQAQNVANQLETAGFITILPGELPDNRVISIIDALLAAPVPAVEIIPNGERTLETLEAFRKRAGDHMLVGAGRVESEGQLQAVIDAGAQFASSTYEFRLPLLAAAKQRDFLYIPTIHAPGQALITRRAGVRWQKIRDDIDAEGLEGLQERADGIKYDIAFVVNQIPIENMEAAYEGGASLVCVNDIFLDTNQPMGDIITRAREARMAWLSWSSAAV